MNKTVQKSRIFFLLMLSLGSVFNSCHDSITAERNRIQLPEQKSVKLNSYGTINAREINECSGMTKSRKQPNVYWLHNDSGDKSRIFAINQQGELLTPVNIPDYQGIQIANASNIDWEDITTDDSGNLIIGDTGNNDNRRQDLAIYLLPEPDPGSAQEALETKKIRFYYPDQHDFPPAKRNFDSEALFWANGKIYLLTKHRSDDDTKLYRFDSLLDFTSNPLTLLDTFNIHGQVTAADASPDAKKLAVLTYEGIWLFEVASGDDYFHGNISWLPIQAGQCESICFDGDILMVSNEGGKLYQVPIKDLLPLKNFTPNTKAN